ncbi:hypothetical protein VKT23_008790 [Stygiomarasmius scandens]|uniref:Transcription factor domain-containing protein n=1 Tax=Marasmiellus scandens TaxID=2682957 RepID=A0ABR1JI51_9AGAR
MSVVPRDDSINPQDHALKILHLIQAHILLAQYLFRTGSVLEGKYYVQGALSLVLGAGFYPEAGHTGQKSVEISELHDIAGPQERIGAFWTSFTLRNLWAIATASSSLLRGDSRCMKDSAGLFFNGHDSSLAKAVYLWDRTTRFDDQHYDDSSSSHFFDLDNMIHQRIQESSFSVSPENVHVQTLLHLAMIDLHKPFPHDPVSDNKIMTSLGLAIRLAIDQDTVEWRVFNPILPVLWRKIAEILVRQIKLHHQESLTRVILNDARVNEYIDSIIGILSLLRTMEELSIHSGLMGLEANRVRSLYELELKGLLDITP